MIPLFIILLSVLVFAIGAAGIVASRHFVMIILAMEVMLVAATLLAVGFFYYYADGQIVLLLFSIWAIAAVEAIALIAFYQYMLKEESTMDVTKLSGLRD
jgi:NADH:ubiquinone oxidoreductase subunit K